jgi:Sulfatase-modifying factor enzyme 1/TIR domain
MTHDVFISYSHTAIDRAQAERVCMYLEAEGFSCWVALRDIPVGADFTEAIWHAIQDCSVLVLVFSAAASGSTHIVRELKIADNANKTVLPIRIEDVEPSGRFGYLLVTAQWLDAVGGIGEVHLKKLALDLRKRLGPAGEVGEATAGTNLKVRTRTNPIDGMIYVFIPPGEFVMGCSPGDRECFDDEKPRRTVKIAHGLWLGQTPVTQAAWETVMHDNPSHFKGDQLPVESVNWAEAVDYCKAVGGRLPTEKEWEYVARAGTTGSHYGSLDGIAWHGRNSGKTQPVGLKQANDFGLYDMLGNVFEWTTTGRKVVRGGSWAAAPRVGARYGMVPSKRNDVGFRCVAEFP